MATPEPEGLEEADTAELHPREAGAMVHRFIDRYDDERLHPRIGSATPAGPLIGVEGPGAVGSLRRPRGPRRYARRIFQRAGLPTWERPNRPRGVLTTVAREFRAQKIRG